MASDPPVMGNGLGMEIVGYTADAAEIPCVKCARRLGDQRSCLLTCACGCGRETAWHWNCMPHDLRVHTNAALSRAVGKAGIN